MAAETVLINFEVDYSELTNAQKELAKTGKVDTKGFEAIQTAIDTTATDSKGLIKTFKDVAGASIKMGKSVEAAFGAGVQDALDEAGVSVEQFGAALKKANAPAITLKKELAGLKEALARAKAEGKDTGKEFEALRARAGKLADSIADANAEIKNAGSDTRGIDNVVGSISALAGGYAAVQGAVALFGEENEDLQKALLKVNAAMALATGIQQISIAVQKEGALAKLADTVATGAQTAATTLLTFVTTGATVAARAYRIALLATGIGAVIVLIVALVAALDSQVDSLEAVNKTIEDNNRLLEESNKLIGRQAVLQEERAKAAGKAESDLITIRGKALAQQYNNINAENRLMAAQRDRLKSTSLEYGALNNRIEENQNIQRDLAFEIEKLSIQGTAQVKKENDERNKANDEYNKKKQEARDKALKDAAAKDKQAASDYFARVLKGFQDEEEALRIHFENEQDIIERDRAAKQAIEDKWEALRQERIASMAKSGADAAAKAIADDDALTAKRIKNVQMVLSVASQVADFYNQLASLASAQERQRIDQQRNQLESLEKAGAITEKQAKIRRQQIDIAERKAIQNQAIREKQGALFGAILNTALAITNAISTGDPYTAALRAAIAAALGAAQIALIAARPIPKFFRGKKDKYEGPGMVADMGSEIVERGGRMFLYTSPTQTYLNANDKVYTAAETKQIMHNTNINTTVVPQKQVGFDYERLGKSIPKDSVVVNIEKDFISEAVANGLAKNNYFNKRYQFKK